MLLVLASRLDAPLPLWRQVAAIANNTSLVVAGVGELYSIVMAYMKLPEAQVVGK